MPYLLAGATLLWLTALTVYDLAQRRLPNALTLPGALTVVAVAAACGAGAAALTGGLALAAGYLLVHLAAPAGLGAGDVKLALGVGALTGAFGVDAWALAACAAPLLTAVWALAGRRRVVPHGPAMCAASAVAVALA